MIDATPLLRLYARRRRARLAALDHRAIQQHQLRRLLHHARNTRFGRDHGFARITDIAAFQRQVPLRRYEDFWRDYWQPAFPHVRDVSWPGIIPYYAWTSGTTTGNTKYIPVSREMLASNRRAVLDIFTFHLAARPDSRVMGGRNFMLGGSTDLVRHAPGIQSGDLSGIAANEVPWWARRRYFPPRELALIADWDRKIDALAHASLQQDIRTVSGTPSWVLPFFDRLAGLRPRLPRSTTSWYPHLELYIHGAVNYAPYRAQFDALLPPAVDRREVYPASEGFIAIADRSYGDGLRLLTDNGLFFEFVPVEAIDAPQPTRHWLGTIETGVNYAVVLSSNAGLFGFVLGDTVRFVERDPPRLLITGRLSYMLSAFGEHLIGEELDQAISQAASSIGAAVSDYTVTAVYPANPQDRGGHRFIVEFATPVADAALAAFARTMDATLASENADYAAHRTVMRAPEVKAVPPGSFTQWMRHRGRLGGQNKVPRVIMDAAMLQDLERFMVGPKATD
ncbi:MAG TPA: GH3 auxin-responsive promoter family protein [Acetobacteraceae bacterium]|nr:GH3 auxin-responsive promoter family protein [Acetobacteraceae bacterium]